MVMAFCFQIFLRIRYLPVSLVRSNGGVYSEDQEQGTKSGELRPLMRVFAVSSPKHASCDWESRVMHLLCDASRLLGADCQCILPKNQLLRAGRYRPSSSTMGVLRRASYHLSKYALSSLVDRQEKQGFGMRRIIKSWRIRSMLMVVRCV